MCVRGSHLVPVSLSPLLCTAGSRDHHLQCCCEFHEMMAGEHPAWHKGLHVSAVTGIYHGVMPEPPADVARWQGRPWGLEERGPGVRQSGLRPGCVTAGQSLSFAESSLVNQIIIPTCRVGVETKGAFEAVVLCRRHLLAVRLIPLPRL